MAVNAAAVPATPVASETWRRQLHDWLYAGHDDSAGTQGGHARHVTAWWRVTADDPVLFLEVKPGDASQFSELLNVEGVCVGRYRVLRCQSAAVPNDTRGQTR